MPVKFTYVVRGDGAFPDDMLRYDGAEFADFGDSLTALQTGVRELTVFSVRSLPINDAKSWVKRGILPCWQRWESFGWKVVKACVNGKEIQPNGIAAKSL
jgi:hypothetical protein